VAQSVERFTRNE